MSVLGFSHFPAANSPRIEAFGRGSELASRSVVMEHALLASRQRHVEQMPETRVGVDVDCGHPSPQVYLLQSN
jgi:hypothetical protein